MHPQPYGQNTDQPGEDGPAGPVQSGLRLSAAQHRDLMPQDEEFDVL